MYSPIKQNTLPATCTAIVCKLPSPYSRSLVNSIMLSNLHHTCLDALDGNSSLTLEALAVPLLLFLLACLESSARMALKHAVLATKVSVTEPAVSNDTLSCVLAVFELTANLLGCSASQRKCQVQCAFPSDLVIRQGVCRQIEMFARIHKTHVLSGKICTDGEQR
jgi:hypothetical protein